ncbi:aminoglycoside phosphotransferase family protein (plasmid) [Rhodococcus pseudokoreensis]|uniref:Aminoglycoside phosphotransferase family protein n=1 Tax=Rhodococcus pseudokoreensis TaxID=2811421 RepID=A0A974VZQ7_9NOCA|nr:aminoglycoside phosphotransferase family protein [Rhodococcus pseudokoreensis]QSE88042.1 aminoglycoside phosphotransferase family protein [Rhodococcus pseudokoreensis]
MHDDEIEVDVVRVRRLLQEQFPEWAHLSIEPVRSAGTDNAMFRLGEALVVRLPRTPAAVAQVEKEHRWLPALAPLLPLPVPIPVAVVVAGVGYPWPWSVYRWLDGENATNAPPADSHHAALELAGFVNALHRIDTTNGPLPGSHNFNRGVPLVQRDAPTRSAIESLRGVLDTRAVERAWDAALNAPGWSTEAVWIHGDLQSGNLLTRRGRLTAVIDFGGLGIGDPACDCMVGWTLFGPQARKVFRDALAVDDTTWARGRGWALSVGLIALPYYQGTNPALATVARRGIEAVLADHS